MDELEDFLAGVEAEAGIELTAGQREAVHMALRRPLSGLMGGAGVGKTTVLRAVHAACERFGRVVHQMALSGRAAMRMREATMRPATTIAGFLRASDAGRVVLGPEALVVVDEASVLDLPLLYRILRRLPEGCRLLLLGDPYQLPPIQFGLSFYVLMESPAVPSAELTVVHRQAEATGIPAVATDVRLGRRPMLAEYAGLGHCVSFIDCGGAEVVDVLTDVVADLDGFDEVQMLSAVKAGPAGVNAINAHLHRLMAVGRDRPPWHDLAVGDPVMYTRNDWQRDLFNGSLGRLSGVDGAYDATAVFDGVEHRLDRADLDALALAYRITAHKAQGSQFRRVALLGDRAAFQRAVAAPPAPIRRETGLEVLLQRQMPAFWPMRRKLMVR